MAEDDQLLQGLGPLLDDDQVEVLELDPQPGDFDLVREPLEAQFQGPSAAPCAHLLAQRPAQFAHVGRGVGSRPQGRGQFGREPAHR
jgi:hypothetical protein